MRPKYFQINAEESKKYRDDAPPFRFRHEVQSRAAKAGRGYYRIVDENGQPLDVLIYLGDVV